VEIQSIVRFFTEHWATAAVIAGLLAVAWGLLGMPGRAPDETDRHIVQAELEGALWKGEPSLLSQLGTRCGATQWAVKPKKDDVKLAQLELDAMPFFGERKAQGRVLLELRTPESTCRFRGTFRYALEAVGNSSIPTQPRKHSYAYSVRANITALAFDHE
jgi:hypothetical protein